MIVKDEIAVIGTVYVHSAVSVRTTKSYPLFLQCCSCIETLRHTIYVVTWGSLLSLFITALAVSSGSRRNPSRETKYWAGLHDNVPDRPSAKAAPSLRCQLATTALNFFLNGTVPNGGLHGRSSHPVRDVSASGLGVDLT